MSGSAGGSVVLREFLLKLGYSEDEQSRRKFTDAIKNMSLTIAALGSAMVGAAAGVVAGVRTMAESADAIYFVSQRTKASAADIRALENAFEDLGGSASQARGLLEKLGEYVKQSPGNVKYLEFLTGKTWRDAATGMEELSEAVKKMQADGLDISVIVARLEPLGFSLRDVQVLLQKDFAKTAEEYRHMMEKILGDSKRQQEIVENAHKFMDSYHQLTAAVNGFATGFGDMLTVKLKPQIDAMKEYLEEHSAAINAFLETASKYIIGAIGEMIHFGEAASEMLGKLHEWYKELTPEGKNLALAIGGVASAIFLLNTAIGKSPVVRLLALAAGLVALYEDYEKWEKTGKSNLIDWDRWEPGIEAAIKGIEAIKCYLDEGAAAIGGWGHAFEGMLGFVTLVWAVKMGIAIASVAAAMAPILAAMAVFSAAAAAGYFIAHSYDESVSQSDRASQMAQQMGLESIGGEFGITGYRGRGGKNYSIEELAAMHAQRHGVDSATQAKSAREGYDQYIAMGASPEMAAALIAQEKRESGFDPGAVGDNGEARGLYQHHKDRRDAMLAGMGVDVANASAADQRRATWWELHHGEKDAYNKILAATAGVSDADKARMAGVATTKYFERPGDPQTQAPLGGALAADYDKAFRNTTPGTLPNSPPPAPLALPPTTTAPAFMPGTHTSNSADDNSTTVHQTNNINVAPGTFDDSPDNVAKTIAEAIKNAQAQAVRNGLPNVR